MQIKQIKLGHWYQTTLGIGKCLAVRGTGVRFDFIDRKNPSPARWMTPKEVDYEIPKGEEPHADDELPATMLDVLNVVKKHIDDLADAWMRGGLYDRDGSGGTRSNRNADVRRLLEKVITREKGGS